MNVALHPTDNTTFISLFAGAGGLDLAIGLALPGSRCVCYVEREVEAAEILAARFADAALDDAPVWSDVSSFDGKPWRGLVDGIAGGFPCQDLSVAGKRAGIQRGNRSGLFYEYVRIIREVEPGWVYIENVPAALAFPAGGIILGELAALGFDAEWGTLRASDVGASHKRKRIWVLAYRRCEPDERRRILGKLSGAAGRAEGEGYQRERLRLDAGDGGTDVANEHGARLAQSDRSVGNERRRTFDSSKALDHPAGSRYGGGRCGEGGEIRFGARRQESDGRCDALVDAECSERRPDIDGCAGSGSRADGAGQAAGWTGERSDALVADYISERGAAGIPAATRGYEESPEPDIAEHDSNAVAGVFAPGPADAIWSDVLVRDYGLRPALSPAEAESCLRRVADGLASPLDQRIDRLRACGNGVVAVQGAAAFRELMRRAGGN